jgi:hypothetical protein
MKKVKTFQDNEEIHNVIVKYCNDNSLKINLFVEKLLINAMRNLNEPTKSKKE